MFGRKLVYRGKSDFGSYTIIEAKYNERPARVLYGDSNTPQSGTALDDNPELLFNYNQRLLEIIKSRSSKKILIIGGGVLMLPIAIHSYFPHAHIDVVEIDPLLIDLAYKYFDAPHSNRLTTFVADGKNYLETSDTMYDAIVVDAFLGHDIPAHLLEHDTLELYKRHLAKDGVLAVNIISSITNPRYDFTKEVITRFEEVFTNTYVFQADSEEELRTEQNIVAVAGMNPIDFEYVQSIDVREFL